tara:strand:+ start:590 stop:1396 length:807 start_codon:yes stop_codon:yes gene_type:complete
MNYLIIDTSYYNFYRFYATMQWYKNAYPDENIEDIPDLSLNNIFINKFEKMFIENINKYKKQFKIDKIIYARDCPRKDIWRNHIYSDYKINRDPLYSAGSNFKGGPVFKHCYQYIIPKLISKDSIEIKIPNLEADDIIYLCTQKIKSVNNNIYIISSDHDLLQLLDINYNIYLYTANLKCYNEKSKGNSDKNNFMKAVLGDTSDNIKKIIPRLGEKTAEKMYNDLPLLIDKFTQFPDSFKKYCINRFLVDFNYIPIQYINDFNNKVVL